MPTYVMLANWTDQGMRRSTTARSASMRRRRRWRRWAGSSAPVYMTMGAYDLMMIYDAPDDAVAARFTLMLGKLGNVRTTSLKAFPRGGVPPDRQIRSGNHGRRR